MFMTAVSKCDWLSCDILVQMCVKLWVLFVPVGLFPSPSPSPCGGSRKPSG